MSRLAPLYPGLPLLGTVPEFLRKGIVRFMHDLWREGGDAVRYFVGPYQAHLFVQPEHVRHMLVLNRGNYIKGRGYDRLRLFMGDGILMSEGRTWKSRRRRMNPFFKHSMAQSWSSIMVDTISEHLDALERRDGASVDLERALIRITMDILVRTLFGVPPVDEPSAIGAALEQCLTYGATNASNPTTPPLFVPTRENRRFIENRRIVDDFIGKLVAERRKGPRSDNDLFGALMFGSGDDPPLSPQELRDEALNLFLAGYETTTVTVVWALSFLSRYPEIQARLQREVDEVLEGRPPQADDVKSLRYARMVLMETMRLRPVVPFTVRDVVEDDEIGPYRVMAGDMVAIAPMLTHMHPEFWPNPEAFDPERFDEERSRGRHPNAYYPFHAGERACGGKHMALLEGLLVVAMVAQRFDVHLDPAFCHEPEQRGTLRPHDRIRGRLIPRRTPASVSAD